MTYITHIVIAIAAYFGLIAIGVPLYLDLSFLALIAGSIFPDIDHPRSFVSNFNIFTNILSRQVTKYTVHRRFMHSILAAALSTAAIAALIVFLSLPLVTIFGFFFGYIMHLVGDTMTKSGIAWLYPYSKKSLSIIGVTTGKKEESAVLVFAVLAGVCYYIGFS